MIVRSVARDDAAAWEDLRIALWPDATRGEHARNIQRFFDGTLAEPQAVLLAEDDAGRPVGLIELSMRAYAEGCVTENVGYIEGWYVVPEARRLGVGRALVAAGEAWARAQGCQEMASDAEPSNSASAAAHLALGFSDVGLIRCFRKAL